MAAIRTLGQRLADDPQRKTRRGSAAADEVASGRSAVVDRCREYGQCVALDGLLLHHLIEPGQMRWLLVDRAIGDRPYNERERRLATLLNMELARLLGRRLARLGEPSVSDLPPRQRDVLVCLMNGDSERQAALKLGISQHTVHDYLKALYVRFGVSSRGELLARCRAFWPVLEREAWRASGSTPEAGGE